MLGGLGELVGVEGGFEKEILHVRRRPVSGSLRCARLTSLDGIVHGAADRRGDVRA